MILMFASIAIQIWNDHQLQVQSSKSGLNDRQLLIYTLVVFLHAQRMPQKQLQQWDNEDVIILHCQHSDKTWVIGISITLNMKSAWKTIE